MEFISWTLVNNSYVQAKDNERIVNRDVFTYIPAIHQPE